MTLNNLGDIIYWLYIFFHIGQTLFFLGLIIYMIIRDTLLEIEKHQFYKIDQIKQKAKEQIKDFNCIIETEFKNRHWYITVSVGEVIVNKRCKHETYITKGENS